MKLVDPDGRDLESVFFGGQGFLVDSRIAAQTQLLLDRLGDAALPVRITYAFRTTAEQSYQRSLKLKGLNSNPVAQPGTSRHESGFALDFGGLQRLSVAQRSAFDALVASAGLRPLKGDPPHFEADPTRFGYASRLEAIRVNQADYLTRFAATHDPLTGSSFDQLSQPHVANPPSLAPGTSTSPEVTLDQLFEGGLNGCSCTPIRTP